MRLFITTFAFTALLVLGLFHVQSLVVGVWTCGVDPVAAALAESGRAPSVDGPGERGADSCGIDPSTWPSSVSGRDTRPILIAPPCTPGASRSWTPGTGSDGYRWLPRMPNAVNVDCLRLRREVGPDVRRRPFLPHQPPSVGTADGPVGVGTRRPGRS